MAATTILKLDGLSKNFGAFQALRNICLEIIEGEFLTIVGPSGSGKTTLIRLLVGMDQPTEGEIRLRGTRIESTPANKRPTCMVFQSLALFPHRTVGQKIEFPLKIRGEPPARRKERACELLELLRLPLEYYGKRIAQCSGGEQQRVALARALAFDPEILFFDEPLSALDYRLRKALEKELKDLHERTGKTFVYITHSLEEAMVMSDRIAIMNAGRFEQIATADQIYARPVSKFVAEFMGEVNLFDISGPGRRGIGSGSLESKDNLDLGLAGDEVGTLMVRPEFVRRVEGKGSSDFWVRGQLRAEYLLGSRLHYEFDCDDGTTLTVEKLREDRFQCAPGDEFLLGWDLANSHVIRSRG